MSTVIYAAMRDMRAEAVGSNLGEVLLCEVDKSVQVGRFKIERAVIGSAMGRPLFWASSTMRSTNW